MTFEDNRYTGTMESISQSAFSQADIEQLADRLDGNADANALTLEGVDGLFCALIASPRTVMPHEYLPTIFGDEDQAFADEDDASATMSLLMRYWNSIIADLERESIHLPFVFQQSTGQLSGREWAQGFLAGTRMAEDGWKELFDSEEEGDLLMIPLMAGEVDPNWPNVPVTPELEEQVLQSLSAGFLRSYKHFAAARRHMAMTTGNRAGSSRAHFSADPYIRPEPKIGRNDPCPCGSGKKFKKCCGLIGDAPLH